MKMLRYSIAVAFPALLAAATLETIPVPSFAFYEENVGQADPEVVLLMRGGPRRTYFSASSIHLFVDGISLEDSSVRFAAADVTPEIQALEAWPGVVNRFEGGAENWLRDIPAHRRVQFTGVFPGVDLIVGESGGQPTFSYVVQPGADLAGVFLDSGSADGYLDDQGNWQVRGAWGQPSFHKPRAYQESGGLQIPLEAAYILLSDTQVGFQVSSFDSTRVLYVEVDLSIGRPRPPFPAHTAIEPDGNIYLSGGRSSSVKCSVTTGGTVYFCSDAFVAGFDSQNRPMSFTVLAGGVEDSTAHVAVDGEGKLLVVGNTASADFPVTADAYQATNAGPIGPQPFRTLESYGDLFVARLDPTNGDLIYSTFFGGPRGNRVGDAAADSQTNVTVRTSGGNEFPTTPGAWFREPADDCQDCSHSAVLRFDVAAGRPLFSTFLPGGFRVMAVHGDGSVYLAGMTRTEVPTTPGALRTTMNREDDGYLVRLAPDGSRPVYATYFGESTQERPESIAVADSGDAWIYGSTAISHTSYLERISADGSRLLSTLFTSEDEDGALLRDPAGNILLYSNARSPSLSTTEEALLPGGCGNFEGHAYLRRFLSDGSLDFATYLPGWRTLGHNEFLDPEGLFHRILPSSIERLRPDVPSDFAIGCVASAATRWNYSRVSPGTIITLIGTRMGPESGVAATPVDDRFPTSLAEVRLWIDEIPAPLLYVQANQINAVTPYGVQPGSEVDVVVEYQGRSTSPLRLDVFPYDFSLFSMTGTGLGQAAALNQDGTLNSPTNPAQRGSIIVLYGTGAGITVPPASDGALAPLANTPNPVIPVQVWYDRQFAEVLYAGPAPGQVNGLILVYLRIPDYLPPGPADIVVPFLMGGSVYTSPATITIF